VVGQEVVDAQGGAVAAQHVVDVVVQPGRVPQLDRPAEAARGDGQELVEALGVPLPPGRELHQRGAELRAEALDPVQVVREPGGGVAQLHPVAAELPELQGEGEALRRLGRPALGGGRRRQAVEGVVHLDRVEEGGVVVEPPPLGELLRVDDPPPVPVLPARAPHVRPTGHGREATDE
jgi:hypothetical protein